MSNTKLAGQDDRLRCYYTAQKSIILPLLTVVAKIDARTMSCSYVSHHDLGGSNGAETTPGPARLVDGYNAANDAQWQDIGSVR